MASWSSAIGSRRFSPGEKVSSVPGGKRTIEESEGQRSEIDIIENTERDWRVLAKDEFPSGNSCELEQWTSLHVNGA